jgi:hypothetical protein
MVSSLERTSINSGSPGEDPDNGPGDQPSRTTVLPTPTSTFVLCTLLVALFVFIIAGTPPAWGAGIRWTARALAALLLLLLLIWHFKRRYYRPQLRSHRGTTVWRLMDYQVYVLQRTAGHSRPGVRLNEADSARARFFTSAIIFPAAHRQRITERYEPGERTLTQKVTIDAQLPPGVVRQILNPRESNSGGRGAALPLQRIPPPEGAPSGMEPGQTAGPSASSPPGQPVFLFPVLVPRKGEMVDNLRVLAADGSELPVLSYRQYLQLVAQALRTLLDIAFGRDISENAHQEAFKAEHLALRAMMQRAEPNGEYEDDSGIRALLGLAAAEPEPVTLDALRLAAKLVRKLTSHYAVVAAIPCPSDGRFVVSYERMMIPTLKLAETRNGILSWLKARARLIFGSRPVDFAVSLDNAWTTQSYHLIVDAEEKVYVGVQEAPSLISYLSAHWNNIKKMRKEQAEETRPQASNSPHKASDWTTPPPYYRFQRRAGQRYAHFYTRFFPEPKEDLAEGNQVPKVRFRFYEVPPGSVFKAVITSFAGAMLIWLIGFVTSRKADPGTDVPAFLLVFPAVAAAWLGFDGPPRRLLEGTLAARLSLAITTLCSIAASGLFMIYKANLPYFRWNNFLDMKILGITSLAWSILATVAILNAASIGYIHLARTWEFMHLSSRAGRFEGPESFVDR